MSMDKRLPRLRRKLLPWLLLSAGVSMLCIVPAAHAEKPRLRPGAFVWQPERSPEQGVVTVLVSLSEQLAHIYRNDVRIATTTISSGRSGHRTPTGVYPILEKRVKHFSNLYDNAPMPYMQRLTWDGIALHGGNLPGYPASHGCIRLPHRFAKLLFEVTARGETTVIVTNSPTPPKAVESLNGSLLALQQAGDKTMLAFSGLVLDTLSAHQERDPFNPNAPAPAAHNLTSASATTPVTPPAVPASNSISSPSTTSSATTHESLPSNPPLAKVEPLSEVKLNYSPRFSQKLSVSNRVVATEIKSADLVLKPLDKPAVAMVVASNSPAPAASSTANAGAPTLTINAPTAKPVEATVLASSAPAAKPVVSATIKPAEAAPVVASSTSAAKPVEATAPVVASSTSAAKPVEATAPVVASSTSTAKPAETMPMPALSELTLVSSASSKAPSPDREFWNPEQAQEGTLRVLVSGADRMLYVYRGKTLIGQGRVQIEQPNYPLGERTVFAIDLFERSSGTPNSDLLRRIQLPATLSTRLYELADPKTLVTITNASAAAHLARSSNWLALAD